MRPVISPLEVDHTIDACKRGAAALVAVSVKLFFGEDITACLGRGGSMLAGSYTKAG